MMLSVLEPSMAFSMSYDCMTCVAVTLLSKLKIKRKETQQRKEKKREIN